MGVGTTAPNSKLEVVGDTKLGGKVEIDSTVVVRDSVTIEKRLTIEQDIKVKGLAVFVDDAKFKSELKALGVAKMKDDIVIDGLTKMNGDAKVFGDFKIKSLEAPTLTSDRLMSINPNGKLIVSNLRLAQDDVTVCSTANIAPWVGADGTNTDDDILLCPNYKSVTISGDFTVGSLSKLSTTGIGINPNSQYQLNIQNVNRDAGIQLFNVTSGNASSKYGIKNVVIADDINAYSVTNNITNQDVFVVKGDGTLNITTDNSTNIKSLTVTDKGNGDDVFRVFGDGTVYATKVVVQETPFPDYVFELNYNLPSLLKLEEFIKANKHLPNMPSAKKVEKDGADLGEINRVLVEKVEELTLYTIQQQKSIDLLLEEVAKLKAND